MTDFTFPLLQAEKVICNALEEDFGRAGDVTSNALFSKPKKAKASFITREDGVIAGLPCAELVFQILDPNCKFNAKIKDGARVTKGQTIATVEGDARIVLGGERTALNLLGRLSGIATLTAHYAEEIKSTNAKITDTRKTTPGLRALEKYAVRCGGGKNHRYGLDDAILIKDNHIAIAGSVTEALKRARNFAGHLLPIEIEVDNLTQFEEALKAGATHVLLDNMSVEQLRKAVIINKDRAFLEASGGVTLKTVRAIAETGVDVISCGALTHSAPNFDVGLDIRISNR